MFTIVFPKKGDRSIAKSRKVNRLRGRQGQRRRHGALFSLVINHIALSRSIELPKSEAGKKGQAHHHQDQAEKTRLEAIMAHGRHRSGRCR